LIAESGDPSFTRRVEKDMLATPEQLQSREADPSVGWWEKTLMRIQPIKMDSLEAQMVLRLPTRTNPGWNSINGTPDLLFGNVMESTNTATMMGTYFMMYGLGAKIVKVTEGYNEGRKFLNLLELHKERHGGKELPFPGPDRPHPSEPVLDLTKDLDAKFWRRWEDWLEQRETRIKAEDERIAKAKARDAKLYFAKWYPRVLAGDPIDPRTWLYAPSPKIKFRDLIDRGWHIALMNKFSGSAPQVEYICLAQMTIMYIGERIAALIGMIPFFMSMVVFMAIIVMIA
jgi:hypothetical protein